MSNQNKTVFQFTFNMDMNVVNQSIQNFLMANNFHLTEKNGAMYYLWKDPISGKRFFEYNIYGNHVTIWVYLRSYKKPLPLDDKYYGSLPKMAYRNMLEPLITALQNMSAPMYNGQMMQNQQYAAPYYGAQQNSGYMTNTVTTPGTANVNNFQANSIAAKEKFLPVALFLAISSILMAVLGYTITIFIVIVAAVFGFNGRNTSKKGLSILILICCAISSLIFMLQLVGIFALDIY